VFGKRSGTEAIAGVKPAPCAGAAPAAPRARAPLRPVVLAAACAGQGRRRRRIEARRSDNYYQVKATIFGALIEAIDLAQLAKLDGESAREEIRDIVNEIIAIKNIVMSIAEQEELLDDICNDVLGYGPLGAAAVARRHRRHHGQWRRHGLHRSRRQDPAHRHPLPRQPAAPQHLPAHRQPGRPARRRILADLRRAPRRRLPRQRHRAAAGDRRPRAHHPQFKKDKLTLDQLVKFGAISPEGRRDPADHRPRPLQRADLRRHRLRQDHAAELS
jgi:pilus assembly protein CpaF